MSQIRAWEPQAEGSGDFADESALVSGLRAGRADAFETLHAAYAPSIYNLALRIVDDAYDAQDVAQEVLIKVLRGLPQDQESLTLPAWLYRVTVNASFDHLRRRKRRPAVVCADHGPEPVSAVDEYERAELSRRVESTLRELPKRQQVALVLRDVHGLSVGETAAALGVTKGSCDVLLSRARAGFRRVFLAGAATGRCGEAERILAGGVGGGVSSRERALLEAHAKTCPDCRREVALWGVAPVGLGLLLPQVALPAKLSLGATLAAAQAAGVALPAGLGAAAAAGASVGGSGASAAASAGATAAAAGAGGAGVLAALGSAAGVKIVVLAAVATAAVGVVGVAGRDRPRAQQSPAAAVAAPVDRHGSGAGDGARVRTRELTLAHHRVGAGGEDRSAGSVGPGGPDAGVGRQGSEAGGRSGDGRGAGSSAGSGQAAGAAGSGQSGSGAPAQGGPTSSGGSSGGGAGSAAGTGSAGGAGSGGTSGAAGGGGAGGSGAGQTGAAGTAAGGGGQSAGE